MKYFINNLKIISRQHINVKVAFRYDQHIKEPLWLFEIFEIPQFAPFLGANLQTIFIYPKILRKTTLPYTQ